MSYWLDKLDELIEQEKKEETPTTLENIPGITLAEFARRNMAVEIYSELLGCNIWLCSNKEMAAQVKKDDPETVTYTTHELRELVKLNPDPEGLKKIHDAKRVFPGSTLKEGIPYEVPEDIKG